MFTGMDFWRQSGIVNQDDLNMYPYTLIGAGGIGSPTALMLTKLGVAELKVYDFDTVEAHNLPNQLYRFRDVGRLKVEALREILRDFSGTDITAMPTKFPLPSRPSGIVISALDSMEARSEVWYQAIKGNMDVPWYIDARMGATKGRFLIVNPSDPRDIAIYEASLYTDEEAEEEPCSARATAYNGFFIGSRLAFAVKELATGEETRTEIHFDLIGNTIVTATR